MSAASGMGGRVAHADARAAIMITAATLSKCDMRGIRRSSDARSHAHLHALQKSDSPGCNRPRRLLELPQNRATRVRVRSTHDR